ncbi:MAG: AmmeMemoRadiSam system protein B, partial [Gammaproteobacteria bacterium]
MQVSVREPAVAGVFYDDQPERLMHSVDHMLASASSEVPVCPGALIVPHAGLRYSGPIAAEAYHAILPWAERIRRVVLLGPSHRVPLQGMAVPKASVFRTPLGVVPVDQTACQRLLGTSPAVMAHDLPHRFEHCLEVQLPFLQRVLTDFSVVPVVVGETPAEEVAAIIQRVWGAAGT